MCNAYAARGPKLREGKRGRGSTTRAAFTKMPSHEKTTSLYIWDLKCLGRGCQHLLNATMLSTTMITHTGVHRIIEFIPTNITLIFISYGSSSNTM